MRRVSLRRSMRAKLPFMHDYPYLGLTLLMLTPFLAGFMLIPSHRRGMLLGGLLAAPWGTWAIALVPDYWQPRVVLSLGKLSIEDFANAFATGTLTWLVAAVPLGWRWTFCLHLTG